MIKKIFLVSISLFFIYILFLNRNIDMNENYPQINTSTSEMKKTVEALVHTKKPRTYNNFKTLDKVSEYITTSFQSYGYNVEKQKFSIDSKKYRVENNEYQNIIATYGKMNAPRFIIGAHYDIAAPFENSGADDNASGVAGLLELSRLFQKYKPDINYRIDFVAYTLEEPPLFQTEQMGSFIHAKSLNDNKVEVIGMIALEMIGYYSEEENSQRFPFPINKFDFLYPTKGNFIAIASNFPSNDLRIKLKQNYNKTNLPTETLLFPSNGNKFLDLSDHASYWKFNYPAILITDTAFFRNENYHTPYDTIDTLNFDKMKEVVNGTYWFLINY